MALDYFDLINIRKTHPSWRLMTAENAPLIAGFLDSVFRENNIRSIEEAELAMRLEDYLYSLSETGAQQEFPRRAREYLDDWAHNEKGWLRKYYPQGSDEPHYDLTPAAEKSLQWLDGLFEQGFIGTESQLYASIELLRQIVHGVEENKTERIKELNRQKNEINRQIKAIEGGDIPMLDSREVRERYIQFSRISRGLLGDFRMVEHNFRELDRSVREEIAAWTGEKGDLLEKIFGEHDHITQSEQGLSFRAFWDFLMSSGSQEEFTSLLDRVFELEDLGDLTNDTRLKRIHFDWINAGEQTQRMVARLSRQLRRFLDDRTYYENKRIVRLLDSIDQRALEARDDPHQKQLFMEIEGIRPSFQLPMERPLFSPPLKIELDSVILEGEGDGIDTSVLYNQIVVDKLRLKRNIDEILELKEQVSLGAVIAHCPLEEGLAELVSYFTIAEENRFAFVDEDITEQVFWTDHDGKKRFAKIPLIMFQKRKKRMNEYSNQLPAVLIALLKGVLYREENNRKWQDLLDLQGAVRDYLSVIGLELLLFEDEGFAFLKNKEKTEDTAEIPQLIVRRQLSYPVSLLLAQLRRKLAEHDASSGEERLIIDKQEIVDLMGTFMLPGSNEVQFIRKIDSTLQKASELDFIRFLGEKKEKIEVKRIIKAFVDAQWLQEFDERMKDYLEYAREPETQGDVEDE